MRKLKRYICLVLDSTLLHSSFGSKMFSFSMTLLSQRHVDKHIFSSLVRVVNVILYHSCKYLGQTDTHETWETN